MLELFLTKVNLFLHYFHTKHNWPYGASYILCVAFLSVLCADLHDILPPVFFHPCEFSKAKPAGLKLKLHIILIHDEKIPSKAFLIPLHQ